MEPPVFLGMWGSQCDTSVSGVNGCDGQFDDPADVAVGAAGDIFVADYFNDRIQRFDGRGTFETKWGQTGAANGQFNNPYSVAVDDEGNVYVADSSNDRIQKFSSDGAFITKWGSSGTGNYQFDLPIGIAVYGSSEVFVSDWFNDRVMRFSTTGTYQLQWGTTCDTSVAGETGCDGDFNHPWAIAVDPSHNVYVADAHNDRIQKFTATGVFLLRWGSTCDTSASGIDGCDGMFQTPSGIAIDADGNVYVADHYNDRIQVFDSSGNFLTKWGRHDAGPDPDPGKFYYPNGVAVSDSGVIYVADGSNYRIQMFGDPLLDFFLGAPVPSNRPF
jgi:DNA-binding beta-propeller fold protein YncE